MAIQSTFRNSFTCYQSVSVAADGERQHMARESCSVTDSAFFIIVLTRNTHVQSTPRAEEYPEICKWIFVVTTCSV